jgi:osmotically-inducible protein OsmY
MAMAWRDLFKSRPYHGGFYAGETGRESMYRTEPSGQGDFGRWNASSTRSSREEANIRKSEGEHRGRGPRGYRRSDERIREEVCECLTDDVFIDASDIEVTVQNGEVMLTGEVASRQQKRHAEDLIESISGVRDVLNNLRVETEKQRST